MTSPPPRLLIVDDSAALRSMLRALFTEEGFHVVAELASGARLLPTVAQLQPDVVCLDYELPDSNGLDLLKQLHAAYPSVAVMMITGHEDVGLEAEAAESGAAGFLRKPFSPQRIVAEIHQVLLAQRLHREHQARRAAASSEPIRLSTARARAVLADDSATMRQLLAAILEQAHVEVAGEASDGQQAIETVARCQPDLVCLDIDMPVLDGLTALPHILSACPKTQVLVVTAHAGRDKVLAAAKAGARGFIVKPFAPQKISEAVELLLRASPTACPPG